MSPFHGADKRASYEVWIFDDPTEQHPTAPLGQLSVVLNPLALYIYTTDGYVVVGAGTQAVQTPASESGLGVVELATAAEVEAGTAGVLVANAARLKAEMDRRGTLAATESTLGPVELATATELQSGTAGVLVPDAAKLAAEITRRLTSEAWIAPTLVNGWSNSLSYDDPTGYYKDALDRVHLRGLITGGTANNIFTLPAGYRPVKTKGFVVPTSTGTDTGRVEVAPDGTVRRQIGINNNLSLAGISFRAGG